MSTFHERKALRKLVTAAKKAKKILNGVYISPSEYSEYPYNESAELMVSSAYYCLYDAIEEVEKAKRIIKNPPIPGSFKPSDYKKAVSTAIAQSKCKHHINYDG